MSNNKNVHGILILHNCWDPSSLSRIASCVQQVRPHCMEDDLTQHANFARRRLQTDSNSNETNAAHPQGRRVSFSSYMDSRNEDIFHPRESIFPHVPLTECFRAHIDKFEHSSYSSKELLPGNWHRPSFSVLTPRTLHVLDRAVNRTSWSRWSKEQPQVLTKNSTEKKHETEETHAGICTASKYTYLSVPRRMTLVKGLKNAPWKILIKISNHRQKSKLSPSIPAPLTNHV